jgi:hypothetical protein
MHLLDSEADPASLNSLLMNRSADSLAPGAS